LYIPPLILNMPTRLTPEMKHYESERLFQLASNIIEQDYHEVPRNTSCTEPARYFDMGVDKVRIIRSCFPENPPRGDPYAEDFMVCINTILQEHNITTMFFLEWTSIDRLKLITAPTILDPQPIKFGDRCSKYSVHRAIKIKNQCPKTTTANRANYMGIERDIFSYY